MQYRRPGKTDLLVSAVGFGTCQLQVIPERKAVHTLLAGFERGVNLVHTAPDYGRAEAFVAKAVKESGRPVIVASQGYDIPLRGLDRADQFEAQFDATRRRFGQDRLDLFGIACIDDREAYGENVWGVHGMVEFLVRSKLAGRLGATFCNTHGSPEYTAKLARSGAFDAITLAWNPLGFRLMTSFPPPDRPFEDLARNGSEILPLCTDLGVGIMVMKPLGGGLLCRSDALPPRQPSLPAPRAAAVLAHILADHRISCVIPGTTSVTEAIENAEAGAATQAASIADLVSHVRSTVCSRCGACMETCSHQLPVAEIIRSGLANLYPSARYELHKGTEYYEVLGGSHLACSSCRQVTCQCPVGLKVAPLLLECHAEMAELDRDGLIPSPPGAQHRRYGNVEFAAVLLN